MGEGGIGCVVAGFEPEIVTCSSWSSKSLSHML